MQAILPYIQIGISILLIGAILIQQRGASLGSSFGGDSSSYSSRRGVEKYIFVITIILALAFFVSALTTIWLR